jgi:hypothetical protein
MPVDLLPIPNLCRFCRCELEPSATKPRLYCNENCKKKWQRREARILRGLEKRFRAGKSVSGMVIHHEPGENNYKTVPMPENNVPVRTNSRTYTSDELKRHMNLPLPRARKAVRHV